MLQDATDFAAPGVWPCAGEPDSRLPVSPRPSGRSEPACAATRHAGDALGRGTGSPSRTLRCPLSGLHCSSALRATLPGPDVALATPVRSAGHTDARRHALTRRGDLARSGESPSPLTHSTHSPYHSRRLGRFGPRARGARPRPPLRCGGAGPGAGPSVCLFVCSRDRSPPP